MNNTTILPHLKDQNVYYNEPRCNVIPFQSKKLHLPHVDLPLNWRLIVAIACMGLLAVSARAQTSNGTNEFLAVVNVDCAKIVGPRSHPENYLNTSILHSPPLALADLTVKEYGRPKIMRCWLTLRHMWDRKTDAYNYNFKIPRRVYEDAFQPGKHDGTSKTEVISEFENYEEYLDAFSGISGEVLLNIRNYEREVLDGTMTMAKWKEVFGNAIKHYKQRCPNIKYIEVINEYNISEAMGGLKMDMDQYYQFYRAAYEVINQFNAEYKPEVPLLVGGPCTYSYDTSKTALDLFLRLYAQDRNPHKRLDFYSFHDYGSEQKPSIYGRYGEILQGEFVKYGLPKDLPIFIDEVGFGDGGSGFSNPERNRAQAVTLTTYAYYSRHSPNLHVFPWVLFHSRAQIVFAQFDQELNITPFGAAVKVWALHKADEIGASVDGGPVGNGKGENGVFAYASKDDTGMAIQIWNYQLSGKNGAALNSGPSATTKVLVHDMPEKWKSQKLKVRQFLIDSGHSNCFIQKPGDVGGLQQINYKEVKGKDLGQLVVNLEPSAIFLWLIEPL